MVELIFSKSCRDSSDAAAFSEKTHTEKGRKYDVALGLTAISLKNAQNPDANEARPVKNLP